MMEASWDGAQNAAVSQPDAEDGDGGGAVDRGGDQEPGQKGPGRSADGADQKAVEAAAGQALQAGCEQGRPAEIGLC